jgi:hypothetical protein
MFYMNSNGLNTNQIMILVIALLMLTSTIGFSLYFSDPSTSAPPIDDPILNQPPATQQIALSAERVEGIIERVLPQMRIAGFTLNNNIEEIDQELRTLPGILRVSNSQLTIDSSGQLLYLGEMEFDPSLDTVGVATQIAETATQLTQLQVVSRVLVRLPDVVQATNAELNITKDYSLSPPYTETYAQLIFSEGDTVLVNLDLAVVNNQVSITGALVVEEA